MPKLRIVLLSQAHYAHGSFEYLLETFKEEQKESKESKEFERSKIAIGEEYGQDVDLANRIIHLKGQYLFAFDLVKLKSWLKEERGPDGKISIKIQASAKEQAEFFKNKKSDITNKKNIMRILNDLDTRLKPTVNGFYAFKTLYDLCLYLKKSNIPYFGIDINEDERLKMQMPVGFNAEEYAEFMGSFEVQRLASMVKNIRNGAKKNLPDGGTLYIINLGMVHVCSLAACLAQSFTDNPIPNLEVEVIPARVFGPTSFYVGKPGSQKLVENFKPLSGLYEDFPKELGYYYEQLSKKSKKLRLCADEFEKSCIKVNLIQNELGVFECPELDKLLGKKCKEKTILPLLEAHKEKEKDKDKDKLESTAETDQSDRKKPEKVVV